MANSFEEAVHHGYSVAEMAADMQAQADAARRLGCPTCRHVTDYHVTCLNMISNADSVKKCPYYRQEGKV